MPAYTRKSFPFSSLSLFLRSSLRSFVPPFLPSFQSRLPTTEIKTFSAVLDRGCGGGIPRHRGPLPGHGERLQRATDAADSPLPLRRRQRGEPVSSTRPRLTRDG